MWASINVHRGQPRVRAAVEYFPGVPIPYLDQRTSTVRAGEVALHVMPWVVYDEVIRAGKGRTFAQGTLEPAPLNTPPQEGDLAEVFVAAMSAAANSPGGARARDLGVAVRGACDRAGWRTVAAMVSTMALNTSRCSASDVSAALIALTSEPARAL